MLTSTARLAVAALIAVTAAGAHAGQQAPPAPPIIQPGAPGQPSRVITAAKAADISAGRFTEADVRFMQGMIGHHAQALEMTALVPDRTPSPDLRKLALRIEISQADEISMMEEWLKARDQPLPEPHAPHAHDAARMPGMLSGAETARLAATRGLDFERLFLEFMIKHHDGALVMVKELFASPGAGQESDIYAFASDVEADQFMEIRRMAAMLKELQK